MMKSKKEFSILVADDVRSMRKLLIKILKMNGFTTIKEADGGANAIEIIQQEPLDLVLVDWNMPGVDGIGVLKALRENSKTCDIPFIMISCEATKEAIEMVLQAGANEYIDKPFERIEIIEKVEKLLEIEDLHVTDL